MIKMPARRSRCQARKKPSAVHPGAMSHWWSLRKDAVVFTSRCHGPHFLRLLRKAAAERKDVCCIWKLTNVLTPLDDTDVDVGAKCLGSKVSSCNKDAPCAHKWIPDQHASPYLCQHTVRFADTPKVLAKGALSITELLSAATRKWSQKVKPSLMQLCTYPSHECVSSRHTATCHKYMRHRLNCCTAISKFQSLDQPQLKRTFTSAALPQMKCLGECIIQQKLLLELVLLSRRASTQP